MFEKKVKITSRDWNEELEMNNWNFLHADLTPGHRNRLKATVFVEWQKDEPPEMLANYNSPLYDLSLEERERFYRIGKTTSRCYKLAEGRKDPSTKSTTRQGQAQLA